MTLKAMIEHARTAGQFPSAAEIITAEVRGGLVGQLEGSEDGGEDDTPALGNIPSAE